MSPRPANPELPERVLEEAAALVEEHGPDGVTVVEIARRVGYTAAAIYRYFASRDELLDRTIDHGVRQLGSAIDEDAVAAEPSSARRLGMFAESYVSWGVVHPGMYELVFVRALPVHPDAAVRARRQGALRVLEAEFARGVERGEFAESIDAPTEARLLWTALHGIVSLTTSGRLWGQDVEESAAHAQARDLTAALVARFERTWEGERS